MGKRLASKKIELENGLYAGTLIEGVIPRRSRFSGVARDLPLIGSMFIRHRQYRPGALNKTDAPSQTILRLHHDKRPQVRRPIHRDHGQSPASRLAAQAKTHTGLHQSLQPDPSRLLRTLLLSRSEERRVGKEGR